MKKPIAAIVFSCVFVASMPQVQSVDIEKEIERILSELAAESGYTRQILPELTQVVNLLAKISDKLDDTAGFVKDGFSNQTINYVSNQISGIQQNFQNITTLFSKNNDYSKLSLSVINSLKMITNSMLTNLTKIKDGVIKLEQLNTTQLENNLVKAANVLQDHLQNTTALFEKYHKQVLNVTVLGAEKMVGALNKLPEKIVPIIVEKIKYITDNTTQRLDIISKQLSNFTVIMNNKLTDIANILEKAFFGKEQQAMFYQMQNYNTQLSCDCISFGKCLLNLIFIIIFLFGLVKIIFFVLEKFKSKGRGSFLKVVNPL